MWIKRKRDSQRQKVYDSESIFEVRSKEESFRQLSWSKMTLEEIKDYCQKLIGSAWFKKKWPQVKDVYIGDGRSRRSACASLQGNTANIKLPKNTRAKLVVLHELSHACDISNAAWHGRPFCRIYLELIKHEIGDEAWSLMKECFKEKNVKVNIEDGHPDLFELR